MKKISLILVIISFLTSCGGSKEERMQKNLHQVWKDGYFEENFDQTKTLDVLIVTNRKAKTNAFGCGEEQFGIESGSALQFGLCKVNVPRNHATGAIDLAKDSRQSSNDYFKIMEAKNLQQSDLISVIKKSGRTPLVFVHGFNVRYQEAVLRASQIAFDLKYQGPIILFTWPAGSGDGFFEGTLLNKTYESNLTNAKASITLFKDFLINLQDKGIKVNLAVHSMGHQVVLPALKQLSETDSDKIFINQLILNAPDFDANEFKSLVKNIKSVSNKVTLYCSYNDKAMFASKTLNKGDRLGACAFFEDIDVINVSSIDDPTLGLGHGYYSSRPILSDVFQTLLGIDADKRLFIVKSEPNSTEKYFLRK